MDGELVLDAYFSVEPLIHSSFDLLVEPETSEQLHVDSREMDRMKVAFEFGFKNGADDVPDL